MTNSYCQKVALIDINLEVNLNVSKNRTYF